MEKVLKLPQQKQFIRNVQRPSTVQMVKSRVVEKTTVKNKEKSIVVQDIFAQVDEALQKKKSDNNRLLNEVADQENQLQYLHQQTINQSTMNAAQSVSLSVSEENLDKLVRDISLFSETTLEQAQECHGECVSYSNDMVEIFQSFTGDMDDLILFKDDIMSEIEALNCLVKNQLEKIKLDEFNLGEMKKQVHVFEDDVKELSEKIGAYNREYILTEDKLKMINKELLLLDVDLKNDCVEIDQMESRQGEVEAQLASLQNDIARIVNDCAAAALQQDEEYSQLTEIAFNLQQKITSAEDSREDGRVDLEQLKLEEERTGGILHENEVKLQAQNAKVDVILVQIREVDEAVANVELAVIAAVAELDDVKQRIASEATKSESCYQLTCQRMKELRDLHQKQPSLEHELIMVQRELESLVCLEEKDVQRNIKELTDVQLVLEEATQRVVHLRDENEQLNNELVETIALSARMDEELAVLEEQLLQLTAREAAFEQEKQSIANWCQQQTVIQSEMAEMVVIFESEKAKLEELRERRSVQDATLTAESDALITICEPLELCMSKQMELQNEVENEETALKRELIDIREVELTEVRSCREKLAKVLPESFHETETAQCSELEALLMVRRSDLSALCGKLTIIESEIVHVTSECEEIKLRISEDNPNVLASKKGSKEKQESTSMPDHSRVAARDASGVAHSGSAKRKVDLTSIGAVSKIENSAECSNNIHSVVSHAKKIKSVDSTKTVQSPVATMRFSQQSAKRTIPLHETTRVAKPNPSLPSSDAATRLAVARGQSKALSDSLSRESFVNSSSKSLLSQTKKIQSKLAPPPASRPLSTGQASKQPIVSPPKNVKQQLSTPAVLLPVQKNAVSMGDWFNDDDSIFG